MAKMIKASWLVKMWRNRNPCASLMGMENGTAAMENNMVVTPEIKRRITI